MRALKQRLAALLDEKSEVQPHVSKAASMAKKLAEEDGAEEEEDDD